MNEEKSYYTVTEIAKRYGITSRAVQHWINDGLLKAERITPNPRSNYRIAATALAEFEANAKENN